MFAGTSTNSKADSAVSAGKPQRLCLKAAAKINLCLDVLGRRTNGYHDIRSIVVPVDVCDVVTLEPTAAAIETVVETGGAIDPQALAAVRPEQNLTTLAALALQRSTGCRGGVRIGLEKNIPVGGGLGGGSADAAAVLVGLNWLWDTRLERAQLMEIGAGIGCDVPALVHGGVVCAEGLGEKVSAVCDFARGDGGPCSWWVVLLNPGLNVPTRDIYARWKRTLTFGDEVFRRLVCSLKAGDVDQAAASLFNGLQETVFRKYPLIEMAAERLKGAGAKGVLLCGSGATVFGLADGEEQAKAIAGRLGSGLGFPAWIKVARILPDGVMVAHGPLEA